MPAAQLANISMQAEGPQKAKIVPSLLGWRQPGLDCSFATPPLFYRTGTALGAAPCPQGFSRNGIYYCAQPVNKAISSALEGKKMKAKGKEQTCQLRLACARQTLGPPYVFSEPGELWKQGAIEERRAPLNWGKAGPFEHRRFCSPCTQLHRSTWQISSRFKKTLGNKNMPLERLYLALLSPFTLSYIRYSRCSNWLPRRGAVAPATGLKSH